MANGNNDYKVGPVEMPCDDDFYERPFFTYGLFKRNQLARSKIEEFIENSVEDNVKHTLRIRDGRPLIMKNMTNRSTKGEKIYFDENCKLAYQRISKTVPDKIYEWDTDVIGGEICNILVAKDIEGTFVYKDADGNYLDSYDGMNDPFFSRVPEFIRDELEDLDEDDENAIFKFQMYYVLLWATIERYSKLKYDVSNKEGDYLRALSQDKVYQVAFEIVDPKERDPIRSAKNASPFIYNKKIPSFIINYYYTVRSNVAHRGKEPENKFEELKTALDDLIEIFTIMRDKTFGIDGEVR